MAFRQARARFGRLQLERHFLLPPHLPLTHHHTIPDHGDVQNVAPDAGFGLSRDENFRARDGRGGAGHEVAILGFKGEPLRRDLFDGITIANRCANFAVHFARQALRPLGGGLDRWTGGRRCA
jgi:hypothetical protein